jgi:hypothetical protein
LGAGNCSWTPQVETILHDEPQGFVSFRTITNDSFRASHPIELPPLLIENVLKGVSIQKESRLLQNLLSGKSKPTPVFSSLQVEFLTPRLISALAQATPEEQVHFQCPPDENSASSLVEGTILAYHGNLILTWKDRRFGSQGGPKQSRPTGKSTDPSGIQKTTPFFSPKQALQTDDLPEIQFLRGPGRNLVVLNYTKLAGLLTTEKKPEAIHPLPTKSEDPSLPPKTEVPSDIKALRNEMKDLQKELAEQKAELEQLKKENP